MGVGKGEQGGGEAKGASQEGMLARRACSPGGHALTFSWRLVLGCLDDLRERGAARVLCARVAASELVHDGADDAREQRHRRTRRTRDALPQDCDAFARCGNLGMGVRGGGKVGGRGGGEGEGWG